MGLTLAAANSREAQSIERAASLDSVNLTVYANPVVDLICPLGRFAKDAPFLQPIRGIAQIHPDGTLEFHPDSYIRCVVEGELCVFGPLNPQAHGGIFAPGGKYPVPFAFGPAAAALLSGIPQNSVAQLPQAQPRVGGGGMNVLSGFYDIFDKLKVQLIATVETASPGHLDRWIKPITEVVGHFDRVSVYEHPGVNLCFEGLGPSNERTILTATMPVERLPDDGELPRARGKTIMVNTVYSQLVALDGFANACYHDAFAVLALTKSLCSKKPVPLPVLDRIRLRHPTLFTEVPNEVSVHSFIKDFVLPTANCVCVFNEEEIAYFTEVDVFAANGRGRSKVPYLGPLIYAMKVCRDWQGACKNRIYVTAGPSGSFVVTENGRLIYCGTYQDPHRPSLGKTAIGDTYATAVLAIETIGNYLSRYVIPPEDVIRAAAAAADASFYYGFGGFGVPEVNLYLGQSNRLLADLGPIDDLPLPQWMDLRLDELKERDVAVYGRALSNATRTLQEVIGRAFLKA